MWFNYKFSQKNKASKKPWQIWKLKKNEKRVVNNIGEDLHKIKGKATPANCYELFEKGEVDNKVRSGRGWLEVVIKCELEVLSKFHVHFTSFCCCCCCYCFFHCRLSTYFWLIILAQELSICHLPQRVW